MNLKESGLFVALILTFVVLIPFQPASANTRDATSAPRLDLQDYVSRRIDIPGGGEIAIGFLGRGVTALTGMDHGFGARAEFPLDDTVSLAAGTGPNEENMHGDYVMLRFKLAGD